MKTIMRVNDDICQTLSVLISTVVWFSVEPRGSVPNFIGFLSSVQELLSGAAATLHAFDAFPPINYLHNTGTISSPIMQHFSIDCQLSILNWSNNFQLSPSNQRPLCFDSPQVPVQSWFDDMTDTELLDLIPLFEGISKEEDVYSLLQSLRNR